MVLAQGLPGGCIITRLAGAGELTSQVACGSAWQVSAGCWQKASVSSHRTSPQGCLVSSRRGGRLPCEGAIRVRDRWTD